MEGVLPSPCVGPWCPWRTVYYWAGFRGACGAVCRLITAMEDQAELGTLGGTPPEPHCRLLAAVEEPTSLAL